MKNSEELIGKKVRGFKFESAKHITFTEEMEKYIGKEGIIEEYFLEDNCFTLDFEDNYFFYPADQIESHLVEENEIPTLTDGVMMLVSDDEKNWEKQEILFKYKGYYYARSSEKSFIWWKYAKPLEPTKEEQLTSILGSSEKVAEIMELFNDKK